MFNIIKKVATPIIPFIILTLILSISAPVFSDEKEQPDEQVFYYLHDHLGGIEAVLDEDGDVTERRDYFPFGSERQQIDPQYDPRLDPQSESYGYTGKELDGETGLYYYGARYYDPAIGRFTQIDPLVLGESVKPLSSELQNPQSLNSYSYVTNNPLRYVDENGEYGSDVHYDLTYVLGLIAGLDKNIAKTIAYHNQHTDENPVTSPGGDGGIKQLMLMGKNFVSGITQKYHFTHRYEAYSRLYEAKAEKSPEKFGQALHTFQDTWSHGKFFSDNNKLHFFSPLGHAIEGHDPDKTYLQSENANDMSRATFYQLRSFKLAAKGSGGLSLKEYNSETSDLWNKAFDIVSEYNSSVSKKNSNIYSISLSSRHDLKEDN